jgi:hypothetical protein
LCDCQFTCTSVCPKYDVSAWKLCLILQCCQHSDNMSACPRNPVRQLNPVLHMHSHHAVYDVCVHCLSDTVPSGQAHNFLQQHASASCPHQAICRGITLCKQQQSRGHARSSGVWLVAQRKPVGRGCWQQGFSNRCFWQRCSKIAEAEAAVSVNEKKLLVMHMHAQLQLDELRGPQTLGSFLAAYKRTKRCCT